MSLRLKVILLGILLLLTLATTAIAANATYQAIQRFQQQKALAAAADVRTIRPWMTIPYIARFYHVPEAYLYHSLHISAFIFMFLLVIVLTVILVRSIQRSREEALIKSRVADAATSATGPLPL